MFVVAQLVCCAVDDEVTKSVLTRRDVVFRVAVGLYVLCVFVLVGGYIAVSAVELRPSIFVQTPETLVAGRDNGTRGIVLHSQNGQRLIGAHATWSINGATIGEGETRAGGYVHAALAPSEATTSQLHVRVLDGAFDPIEVDADVVVAASAAPFAWPEGDSRLSDEKPTSHPWEGALRVRVIPAGAEVPRGLQSTVYLLVTDAETHEPVQAEVAITKVEGLLEGLARSAQTDTLGLARFELRAMSSARLTLTVTDTAPDGTPRTTEGTVRIHSVASQYALQPQQLMVLRGKPVNATVQSLHRSGGLLADLYDGQHWVRAAAFGITADGAGVQLNAPDVLDAPLVRLQVYGDLFTAGNAWDSRWLVPSKGNGPLDCFDALHDVLRLHQSQNTELAGWASAALQVEDRSSTTRCAQQLEAALLAVPPEFVVPHARFNTRKAEQDELEAWRADVQTHMLAATVGVLLVGFFIVLLFVAQGLRRREQQAASLREVELESSDLDRLPPKFDFDRLILVIQSLFVLFTLLTFGASLVMLMTWM